MQWNNFDISSTQQTVEEDRESGYLKNIVSILIHYYVRDLFPMEALPELLETMVEIKQFHDERRKYQEKVRPEQLFQTKRIVIQGTTIRPSFSIYDED